MDRLTCCVVSPAADPLLGGCLDSLVGTADDIVVVTGQPLSSKPAGVRLLMHDFSSGLGAARNRALTAARGQWVLALEPHERLAPSAGRALRKALSSADFDCGLLPLHSASRRDATPLDVLSGKARHGAPVLWPRLVRRTADLRWDGEQQEAVLHWLAEGRRVASVDAPILAWGAQSAHHALTAIRARVAVAPEDWRARAELARELARCGELASARVEIERAWLSGDRQASGLVTLRAFLQLRSGEAEAALATLGAAATPESTVELLRGASLEQLLSGGSADQERLRAAERALGRARAGATEGAATAWAADTLLGLIHLHDRRWADALRCFEQALVQNPAHLDAVLGRAEALIQLGSAEDALRTLEPVLEVSDSDGWLLAASACESLGLTHDAAPLLARARDEDRFIAPHRARTTERLGARVAAAATLEALDPERRLTATADALDEGHARFAAGDLAGAHDCFKAALRQDSGRVEAWSDLGVSLAADADLDGSLSALRTAVALDPDAALPRANLAAVLWQLDRSEEAVGHLRAALAADPQLPLARNLLHQLGLERVNRPRVLLVEGLEPTATLALVREVCARAGVGVHLADPALIRAHASAGDSVGTDAFWQAAGLDAVIIDAHAPHARRFAAVACAAGAPVIWSGPGAPASVTVLPEPPEQVLETAVAWADRLTVLPRPAAHVPRISVLIDGIDHRWTLGAMLDHLALQDLPPALFEVIVVTDEDTPAPHTQRPYVLHTVRLAGPQGPGVARDAALAHASGEFLVLLAAHTRPATDTLRGHLVGQAQSSEPLALLGEIRPAPELAARAPLAHLEPRQLITPLTGAAGARMPARFLRTQNTSLPRAAVEAAGGFSTETACASSDTALGLRLERACRLRVQPRPELASWRDTAPELETLIASARSMGFDDVQLYTEHRDRSLLRLGHDEDPDDPASWFRFRARVERLAPRARQAETLLRELAHRRLPDDAERAATARGHVEELVRVVVEHATLRGQAAAGTGLTREQLVASTPLTHTLTSIVINADGPWAPLERTLASLREHTRGPVEVLVVDRGLDATARTRVTALADVRCLGDGSNLGDARAHLLGLAVARGETIALTTSGVEVSSAWRSTLLAHLQAWPDVGIVAPMVHRRPGAPVLAEGQHAYTARFDPTFIVLRRTVIETIGGLDAELGPGRLAYEDFGLRAAVAGLRTRQCWDAAVLASPTPARSGPIWPDDTARFAARWDLPTDQVGSASAAELLGRSFDPERHVVPLARHPDTATATLLRPG